MKLDKIPTDIKFGDILFKNCDRHHAFYLGKINSENSDVFLKFVKDGRIIRNNDRNLSVETFETHPHIFILFKFVDDYEQLYFHQCDDGFEGTRKSIGSFETYDGTKEIPKKLSKILNEMKQLLGVEKMKTMPSEKIFICHKTSRDLYCSQDGFFVKYANENDTRTFVRDSLNPIKINPDLWQPINIDYPTYLILTGLKEKSKETELAEIKAKILSSETLGCQKDVMSPLVEDLLSLVHKVEGLKRYKKEVVDSISMVFSKISRNNGEMLGSDLHKYEVTRSLLKNYVEKLQEK